MTDETKPYIKDHGDSVICFADTLTQAKHALERSNMEEAEASKLDNAHLMLFGVEEWDNAGMDNLRDALKKGTNQFNRFEVFGCEMNENAQIKFGELLDPEALQNITRFDLDNTVLEPKGAHAIFEQIAEVPSIQTLNLQGSIGGKKDVMAAISDKLVQDSNIYKSLSKVDLKINELNAECAEFAAALIPRLQSGDLTVEMDLFYNNIEGDGAVHIARALKDPATILTKLDLSCNNIGDKGAEAMGDALLTNRSLKELKLALNNIGNAGAIALLQSLAPIRQRGVDAPKNTTLEILDLSANTMKEMEKKDLPEINKDALAKRNELEKGFDGLVDENENPLPGKEKEVEDLNRKLDEIKLDTVAHPLADQISRTCLESHLKEFDFTGIEFGKEMWDHLGHNLQSTTLKTYMRHAEPMTIRFSIVDCMNEENLKVVESYIWGKKEDNTSGYHIYKHIDWRRRDEDGQNN